MNIDHELKQRLMGAFVVTILSAILIPMLFDDSVEEDGQVVSNLSIPVENQFVEEPPAKLPVSAEQVLALPPQNKTAVASVNGVAPNTLRPDEMEDISPVTTAAVSPTEAAPVIAKPVREKPRSEKTVYSETTNYDIRGDEVDDEPPMKPKLTPKKTPVIVAEDDSSVVETKTKKPVSKLEEELLKQVHAAKLTDSASVAPVKSISPVGDSSAADAKKIAAAVAAPKTPAAPSRWYIQVGSFTKKENATALLEGLQKEGLPALLEPVQTEKGVSYRLRVGPELDGKRAASMKRKMDEQNIKSILVAE
jgi:DedD protein